MDRDESVSQTLLSDTIHELEEARSEIARHHELIEWLSDALNDMCTVVADLSDRPSLRMYARHLQSRLNKEVG